MTGDATPAVNAGVLTVAETAELLRCSESTVRRLVDHQGLPALRHGTWIRIPRHALNQWMTRQGLEAAG